MNFSEEVKKAMSKHKLKTADIARATGYSYQHIHDLLAGDRRWNEESINRVCEALGIKIEITCNEEVNTTGDGETEKEKQPLVQQQSPVEIIVNKIGGQEEVNQLLKDGGVLESVKPLIEGDGNFHGSFLCEITLPSRI